MSWNPNEKDPWGRKNNPPDLDDAIEQLRKMFSQANPEEVVPMVEVQALNLHGNIFHIYC